MLSNFKRLAVIVGLLGISSSVLAHLPDDSTHRPGRVKTTQSLSKMTLLAQGEVTTTTGDYDVDIIATDAHCTGSSTPLLTTSIKAIAVYGWIEAIEGVNNTLTLSSDTKSSKYRISGTLSAPVNQAARDNGVTANWQIWCQP